MARKVEKRRRGSDRTAVELVEEATGLLRRCPPAGFLAYFLGAVPFVLTLMFFWADMSRGWDASSRLVAGALGLALSYLALKIGQAVFCEHLGARLSGRPRTKLGAGGWLRLLASQAIIHTTAIPVLLLSLLATIPFGWVYAFYHNCSVLAVRHAGEGLGTSALAREALSQARHQPVRNHLLILILSVFSLLVWINVAVSFVFLPTIARSLTGIDTVLSRSAFEYLLTSTVLASITSLTFIVVSPLVKALYTLGCFYGLARKTGDDLGVQFRAAKLASPALAPLLLAALVVGLFLPSAHAQAPDAAEGAISAEEFDTAAQTVLEKREYRWRLPPTENDPDEELGAVAGSVRDFALWVKKGTDMVVKKLRNAGRWIWDRIFPERPTGPGTSGEGSGSVMAAVVSPLLRILCVILAVALLAFLVRALIRHRRAATVDVAGGALEPEEVDLEDEEVTASALPEDEWMRLVREKMEEGDLRLALRALFLATLAHLGEERAVAIAKGKTNGDYLRELAMRGRLAADLRDAFAANVRAFERSWYGWHEVTQEVLEASVQNHERISANAG